VIFGGPYGTIYEPFYTRFKEISNKINAIIDKENETIRRNNNLGYRCTILYSKKEIVPFFIRDFS
jgi:hypothetical protein